MGRDMGSGLHYYHFSSLKERVRERESSQQNKNNNQDPSGDLHRVDRRESVKPVFHELHIKKELRKSGAPAAKTEQGWCPPCLGDWPKLDCGNLLEMRNHSPSLIQ